MYASKHPTTYFLRPRSRRSQVRVLPSALRFLLKPARREHAGQDPALRLPDDSTGETEQVPGFYVALSNSSPIHRLLLESAPTDEVRRASSAVLAGKEEARSLNGNAWGKQNPRETRSCRSGRQLL
jgi:hypothetical protein